MARAQSQEQSVEVAGNVDREGTVGSEPSVDPGELKVMPAGEAGSQHEQRSDGQRGESQGPRLSPLPADSCGIIAVVSEATTEGIRVEVSSFYVEERSTPREDYYFFAYRVRISNLGPETAQLISRRWCITDADGRDETVEGPGVVGEQPILQPGAHFEYTSFCPLPTVVGSMRGSYQMRTATGRDFEAEIPAFTLAVPHAVN